MTKMVEIVCACGCGRKKQVREADRKCGWGRFYSKSCKAKWQERRTGQHTAYLHRHDSPSPVSGDLDDIGDLGDEPFSNEEWFDKTEFGY